MGSLSFLGNARCVARGQTDQCPRIPPLLRYQEQRAWSDGLRWEAEHFDRQPADLCPRDLSLSLRQSRLQALCTLFSAIQTRPTMLYFETVVVVDRVLLTKSDLADVPPVALQRSVEVIVAASCLSRVAILCPHEMRQVTEDLNKAFWDSSSAVDLTRKMVLLEQVLGSFANNPTYAPCSWFAAFVKGIPQNRRPVFHENQITNVFQVIAIEGTHANRKPSAVAAAALVYMWGDQALDFLGGYTMLDILEPLEYIRSRTSVLTGSSS